MGSDSIAAFYHDYSLYWYGITMGAAVLFGVLAAMFMRSFQDERVNDVLFVAVPAVPFGLMGARSFYSWHGTNVRADLRYLTDFGSYLEGGLGLYGALGAGLIVMVLICLIFKINIPKLADACSPGLALGICIGRLASQFSTTDRGAAVSADWLKNPPFSTFSEAEGEWLLNVYFFEAFIAFMIFALLSCMIAARYYFHRLPCRKGDVALTFMFLYGLSQCFFEAIRSDSLFWNSTVNPRLHFVMISQAISAVVATLALSVLILRFVCRQGITVFSVFTVVLSAFCFCMIFSQEIRLPFKDEAFINIMIAQGALILIIMGFWLLYRQAKDFRLEPVYPWLSTRFWLEKIKKLDFFASREKGRQV